MSRPQTVDDILAQYSRGGGLWSDQVSQRAAAHLTLAGARRGWRPSTVTVSAAAVGVATSLVVMALGGGVLAAIVAVVGWQVAYALDGADGQLARVTGRTSDVGGVLDLYGDWLHRVVLLVALFAVVAEGGVTVPSGWVVVLVAGNLAALFHQALDRGGAVGALTASPLHRAVQVVRDPGVMALLFGIAVGLPPAWTVGVIAYGALHGAAKYGVRLLRLVMRARGAELGG